jgi:catechol 2,3-dioxygenase-like lactoylglutathione lyase family enzyme
MALVPKARLGHVGIEVSDLAAALKFYDAFLPTIGFRRYPTGSARWRRYRRGSVTFWLTESHPRRVQRRPARVPRTDQDDPVSDHLAFVVRSGRQVAEVQQALARKGLRPLYPVEWQPTGRWWYVSAAWSDPDGTVLEVYATPRRTSPRAARRISR